MGSVPVGVDGNFHGDIPSGRTVYLGSNLHLTEMITGNIAWGKGGRCLGLAKLSPWCADF